MRRTMESIQTLNSLLRTLLGVVLVGGLGAGGWYAWSTYHAQELEVEAKDRQLQDAQQQLAATHASLEQSRAELEASRQEILELQQQVERLDTSLRLLKVSHRVAKLRVIDQRRDADSGDLYTDVEFLELGPDGQPIAEPRQFRIRGDVVYLDHWVVKFDDKYVEQADLDRSTSLVLFRRIYGEYQQPREGFPLDEVGSRPEVYGRARMSEFEQRIWDDFWNIANDEQKAAEMGIRAAHGDAPFIKVQKGKTYRILLRASDGISIQSDAAARSSPPNS